VQQGGEQSGTKNNSCINKTSSLKNLIWENEANREREEKRARKIGWATRISDEKAHSI